MAGHGEKLSRKREQAIAALLSASTLVEAAKAAGIGDRTLWRWLQDPHFQTAYRQARRDAVGQAIARLQQVASTAVDTLESVMKSSAARDSARVAAARAVLELGVRAIELEDLEARLTALEQHLATPQHRGSSHGQ
jgi:hypothetical protein